MLQQALIQTTDVAVHEETAPLVEQRREPRSRAVYRLVHVERGDDEGLARCRNISDGGMKLQLTMPVQLGSVLTVTFSPTFACVGRVVWYRGNECGVVFDYPIDSSAVLRDSAAETSDEGLRPLRLRSEVPALVRFDGHEHQAVSTEVTQFGMQLRHSGAFRSGLSVTVVLGGGRERRGIVRWTSGDMADLVLLEPFSVADLGSVGALTAA